MAHRPAEGWSAGDDRRHLADRGLHRQPRRPVRRDRLRRARRLARTVPREGSDVRAPADRHGRVHQPRDGRDPRAVGVHGRLPVDDRARHVRHQRHRARRRHPARALPRGLPDGAQGPREAGLHRQPDAGPRLVAGARDRQEGQGLRPHRPQAQAARHGAAARDGLRRGRGDHADLRELALHPQHAGLRHGGDAHRRGRADRAVQEAAPRRAAVGRERQGAAQPAVLRPQALRPHARGPLQAQLAPRARHRPRHAHAHQGRHRRADQGARVAAQASRACPRNRNSKSRTTPPRRCRCRASPSPTTSTSTSTSATAACAPSAS